MLILFLGITTSQAQITFQRTYGTSSADYGRSVTQTLDGGYLLLGDEPVFGGAYTNSHLIKTNQYGDTTWTKSFGDSIHGVQGWDVCQLPNGDILIKSGYNQNVGMNIIKMDSSGTVIWNKFFANSGYYSYGGIDTAVGGGYVFLGQAFSSGHWNTYVLRTDANGDSIWGKSFGYPDTIGLSIKTTNNGYVICGGSSNYPAQHNVLTKIDTSGNRVWTKLSGGTAYDIAYSLATTNGGGFVFVGTTTATFPSPEDVALTKTDSQGNVQWTRTYGGNDVDVGYSVRQTPDGGYAILGVTQSMGNTFGDFYLIKTDAMGFEQWHKTYGANASETGYCLALTSDGGYAMLGHTQSFGAGNFDFYFVKADSAGNVTSINDISKDEFSLYPNPTSGKLKIRNAELKIQNINIYNLLGEKVFVQKVESVNPSSEIEINVSSFTNGIYFLQLQADNNSYVRKFTKQ